MKELIYYSDQQDLLPSQFRDTDLKQASIRPDTSRKGTQYTLLNTKIVVENPNNLCNKMNYTVNQGHKMKKGY